MRGTWRPVPCRGDTSAGKGLQEHKFVVPVQMLPGFEVSQAESMALVKVADPLRCSDFERVSTEPVKPVVDHGHTALFFVFTITLRRIPAPEQIGGQTLPYKDRHKNGCHQRRACLTCNVGALHGSPASRDP